MVHYYLLEFTICNFQNCCLSFMDFSKHQPNIWSRDGMISSVEMVCFRVEGLNGPVLVMAILRSLYLALSSPKWKE